MTRVVPASERISHDRRRRARPLPAGALMVLALLWALAPAHAGLRISEFMAENDGSLTDRDGASPDWIEIRNDFAGAVNLGGWHLTDTPTNLSKWSFPATNLASGGYLVVFASGKDRATAGAELHTNFRLNLSGGFLALVEPDGATIADAWSPAYPPQRANVAFGSSREVLVTPLIATGAVVRVLVPTNGGLGTSWTLPGFDDASWTSALNGVGYDAPATGTNPPGAFLLSLDFSERAQTQAPLTPSGFTAFVINSNVSATAIQTGATVRAFGGLTVTLSNTAPNGYDDRLRATPTNSGPFTDSLLLRDLVMSESLSGTGGLVLAIAGLPAGQSLTGTIWSFDGSTTTTRRSDWYANGLLVRTNYWFNGSLLPASNEANRITFTTAASPTGTLLLEGRRNVASPSGSHAVYLNALQLAQAGYGALIASDLLLAMSNRNSSAYLRFPFTVAGPAAIQTLKLRVKYDDGFIAHLNGQFVASRNAPASPAWNSAATVSRSGTDAVVFEDIYITNAPGLLLSGPNVLAVQGLNVGTNDNDFLFLAALEGVTVNESAGRYFKPATPGVENGPGYLGFVEDTKFSVDRGFYDTPFTVAITSATATATIYWTTNGSAPSPTNGTLYTSPLAITNTTNLRAAAFAPGLVPTDVDTESYLCIRQILRQPASLPGYPTTWQASYPADYGMDANIVNHPVYGATISNDLRSIPSLCIVSDHSGLWSSSTGIYPNPTSVGPAWERAASVELIRGDGNTEFATTCKIQIHGNASRDNVRTPKHSFGLSFNSDYGPSKLRYDWFGGGVDVHDAIVLRCCGFVDGWAGRYADDGFYTSTETGETFRGLRYRPENTCYLRDVWVKESLRAMGWSASRSAYVHLYLNGLYWGLYEPSEHLDASYFSLLLGGEPGAWDVLVGEDNNGPPVIVDGSGADWTNVLNLVNAGITSDAAYQAVAQLVDLDNLIDYMMLHLFAESEDWPRHNWYLAHRREKDGVPGTKFICTAWDQELTLDRLVRRNRIDVGNSGGEVYGPARVYAQLRAWPEFRLRFADRVQKHLFNGGALTPSNNIARLLAPAAIIHDALVGESARWGDARINPTPGNINGTGKTFTRDEWWQLEIDKLATNFFLKLTTDNVARFRVGNLYPVVDAPDFSQFGGAVPAGFALAMNHTNAIGTIFYTLDGSDPRAYGSGAVAPSAQAYAIPVPLNAPTLVRARVLSSGQWSALVEATFYPPQDFSRLVLSEIIFNPLPLGATNGDEFEFLELKNVGTNTLNLSGLTFTDGITFTFTNGAALAPGGFFVLVRNAAAFARRYPGVAIGGVYSGKLDNGGEMITLSHPLGGTVFSLTYSDAAPWPLASDGHGFSLVQKDGDPAQAPDDGAKWRASTNPSGSPGADDPPSAIPPVVINEILSASGPGQRDTIELFNPATTNVDIGGWFLTDDPNVPKKFRIMTGTSIPAQGFAVFDENQFNPTPGTNGSFALNARGDAVYLWGGDARTNLNGYTHGFAFGPAASGTSFGRYVTSVGEEQFPAQIAATFGATNAGPRVGPVVINEIHYHPAAGGDPFVELKNISATPVLLADSAFPTNIWRLSGLDFAFPTNIVLGPGNLLLLVATNAAEFRAKFAVPTNVAILGPYIGTLQQSGERLALERPDAPDTNGLAFIAVDEIRYNDRPPWPAAADGAGPSLQRINSAAYCNDPINWLAAVPTPGRDNTPLDTDGDGLPDAWEIANGTDPNVPDADADPDHDGLTNMQEFLSGTNSNDPNSVLRLDANIASDGTVSMNFLAVSNRTYSLLSRDSLLGGIWSRLSDFAAHATNRVETVPAADSATTNRFFRLVTPAWP